MRLLRDRAGLTRLLLLLELQRGGHTKLQPLADALGITVQGVSNHIGELQRSGMVRAGRGRYELMPRGSQALQGQLAELKAFTDLAWQRAMVAESCAAVAQGRVSAGDPVGLFLEEGVLVARARARSASRGIAASPAKPGEVVRVRALEGLVAWKPGRLVVVKVPAIEGAATPRAARALRALLARERPDKVGVLGTEAQAVARAARRSPDFTFAAAHAAHHAAQLGLSVVLLASEDEARFATAELDRLNEDAVDPVRYDLRELRVGR
ncbi:MAG TPA: winged helix-turn-helix transcriptional regulator [Candidatus Thermoplasmatota archaeon]|nr:winged helix-turn-helix transcriptional regulator [Candidatus Thermoplasmatota archaeon]